MHYILALSRGNKHFSSAIQEYSKRLGSLVTPVILTPFKHKNPQTCIQRDSEMLIKELIKKKYRKHTIRYLDIHGRSYTSEDMSTMIVRPHVFVIGGAYGRDRKIVQYSSQESFSLSSLTLPHGLAQLVLWEQLYRGYCIHQGKTYHY